MSPGTIDGFPPGFSARRAKQILFDQIRPQVRRFAHMMEQKFRLHDEERGNPYKNASLDFLLTRLREEHRELLRCVHENKSLSEWERESADVGNCLSMIVEWKRNSYKKGWGKP